MKRADLYPMRVNPFNFKKGDVVKKIYSDKIRSPYTGIVTAIIPSTNKVEVQWPDKMGMEDPWDLIKVNPLLHPPVVNEDKSYKTFQNELSRKYYEHLQPHNVLNSYLKDILQPSILQASDLYNKGMSKKKAFNVMASSENAEKRIIVKALDRVFNDEVNIKKTFETSLGDLKVSFTGNSDNGFCVKADLAGTVNSNHYDSIQHAFKMYKAIEENVGSKPISSDVMKNASVRLAKINKEMKDLRDIGATNETIRKVLGDKYSYFVGV